MRFDVLTLFPNLVLPYFEDSILKRAIKNKKITVYVHNIRTYSKDKHHKVDDTPYGGGAGMVMTCQPLFDAIKAVRRKNKGPVIYLSPRGKRLTQNGVEKFAKNRSGGKGKTYKGLILLCGRYEGIDQRVIDQLVDEEISVGDYVLTGGELAALVLIDAITRLLPGVLGAKESPHEESFSEKLKGMLEYPHYTKPAEYQGLKVPKVLLSGNHAAIARWRKSKLKRAR